LWGRVGERFHVGLEAGLLAGGDDAVVVGGGELAREQEQRLVLEARERDRVRAGQAMAFADQDHVRLPAQELAADTPHRLRVQSEPCVELAGKDAAGDLGAEELAGDDGHVRGVVLDDGQDRGERLEAGRRGVAESYRSGDARPGEAGALGRTLERGERRRRLLEERATRGGELDVAAGADEQIGAERALELVDLVAQRRLGDVEARGGAAEVELLRNGQEVAEQARLEIDSPRLTLARNTGLGRRRRARLAWLTMSTAATVTSLDGFHATPAAQRKDELVRGFFDAVNAGDETRIDELLDRGFLSYDLRGTRSRTGLKRYYADLRRSFSDLRFDVHENVGVLVEGDRVALRTIVTGTHTGDWAGVAATGNAIQTSASHIFRVDEDRLVEHWPVVDTYRILVAIGAIPGVANVFQEQILRVPPSPGGLFQERLGTEFGGSGGRPVTREESLAAARRLYDGVIATGRAEDVDMVAEGYIQNSGWTPDGRAAFASALVINRGAMPDGRATQTHIVAENNRLASRSVWDGTISETGRPADFTTLDFFRIEDGLIAEHWESVDWVRAYQSFALLSDEVRDG
jgi:predicted ester cyclase